VIDPILILDVARCQLAATVFGSTRAVHLGEERTVKERVRDALCIADEIIRASTEKRP
jgi:hypothetical protein